MLQDWLCFTCVLTQSTWRGKYKDNNLCIISLYLTKTHITVSFIIYKSNKKEYFLILLIFHFSENWFISYFLTSSAVLYFTVSSSRAQHSQCEYEKQVMTLSEHLINRNRKCSVDRYCDGTKLRQCLVYCCKKTHKTAFLFRLIEKRNQSKTRGKHALHFLTLRYLLSFGHFQSSVAMFGLTVSH